MQNTDKINSAAGLHDGKNDAGAAQVPHKSPIRGSAWNRPPLHQQQPTDFCSRMKVKGPQECLEMAIVKCNNLAKLRYKQ